MLSDTREEKICNYLDFVSNVLIIHYAIFTLRDTLRSDRGKSLIVLCLKFGREVRGVKESVLYGLGGPNGFL